MLLLRRFDTYMEIITGCDARLAGVVAPGDPVVNLLIKWLPVVSWLDASSISIAPRKSRALYVNKKKEGERFCFVVRKKSPRCSLCKNILLCSPSTFGIGNLHVWCASTANKVEKWERNDIDQTLRLRRKEEDLKFFFFLFFVSSISPAFSSSSSAVMKFLLFFLKLTWRQRQFFSNFPSKETHHFLGEKQKRYLKSASYHQRDQISVCLIVTLGEIKCAHVPWRNVFLKLISHWPPVECLHPISMWVVYNFRLPFAFWIIELHLILSQQSERDWDSRIGNYTKRLSGQASCYTEHYDESLQDY